MSKEVKLGVNVDHVATLREVRGTPYPDPMEAAVLCKRAGAHSLTVHLREDRRHIQEADVRTLCAERILPVNLEMANNPNVLSVALDVVPDEVCMVPEKREELTTEGGLDVVGNRENLAPTIQRLKDAGVLVSLFIEPDEAQVEASASLGAPVIELHTGTYAFGDDAVQERELERLCGAATLAVSLGLQVNAGHGLHVNNVEPVLALSSLDTLNIGHSIVARAVLVGMEVAVREMLEAINA